MSNGLGRYISDFSRQRDLSEDSAEPFLDAILAEREETPLIHLLSAWNEKGITEEEIFSIARILRERCTKISSKHSSFVDIVGTGGSASKTFNISTAAAFVVAGDGLPVAKHGNKAASSKSGSADVLAELGVKPNVEAEVAEKNLNEIGICFLFAPNFHRLSPALAKARRDLGVPTVFNCLGPLCNPAAPPHQLIGVWDEDLLIKMAGALSRFGTTRSWLVHGVEGVDEISLSGQTKVAEVVGSTVRTFEISADDFGIAPSRSVSGKLDPGESAAVIKRVLAGDSPESWESKTVQLNAAAAIFLADNGQSLLQASRRALESISKGNGLRKLEQLAEASAV